MHKVDSSNNFTIQKRPYGYKIIKIRVTNNTQKKKITIIKLETYHIFSTKHNRWIYQFSFVHGVCKQIMRSSCSATNLNTISLKKGDMKYLKFSPLFFKEKKRT